MSMLIVTIPWGPLIARVTLDTQETEQPALVNTVTLFSIMVSFIPIYSIQNKGPITSVSIEITN